jgi:hypothetical protein
VPELAWNETALLADRFSASGLSFVPVGRTPAPGFSVDATAPALLVVGVVKVTSTVESSFTAPPPVWTIRRAPAPSMRSVTVAPPLQCGTMVMRTAPTWGSSRSAMTSYTRSVERPLLVVHVSDVRSSPQPR